MAELDPVPRRVETHQSDEKRPRAPVLDGWRCDLCGEIVTAQERPLVPPENCPRCSSSNMTSMEVWAARRPPLGLWTR
jgi:rubrerythrin